MFTSFSHYFQWFVVTLLDVHSRDLNQLLYQTVAASNVLYIIHKIIFSVSLNFATDHETHFFLHIVDASQISSRVISRFRNGLILLRFGGVSPLEVGPSKHFRTNSCVALRNKISFVVRVVQMVKNH